MKYQIIWLTILIALAGMANAQLEVGGQAFESNSDSAPTPSSDNLELQVWVGLNELDGYDPGAFGAETDELSVAIATFQIKNGLAVDGQVTEALAQAVAAAVRAGGNPAVASESVAARAADGEDPCLRQEAAQTASKAGRFARIARAGERLFNRAGGDSEIGRDVSKVAGETSAIARDVAIISPDCQP